MVGFSAYILSAPTLFGLGVVVEQQFEVSPLPELSGGWKDHIWKQHGPEIVACMTKARHEKQEIACRLVVRPR